MDFEDSLDCEMCRNYVHDTIKRPFSIKDCIIFGPLINIKRAMKHVHMFVPEFIRATFTDRNHEHLALLFVESDGVVLSKCFSQESILPVARMWVANRLTELGDLSQLHYFHTDASPPPDAIVTQTTGSGLRIRIPPPTYDDLYD